MKRSPLFSIALLFSLVIFSCKKSSNDSSTGACTNSFGFLRNNAVLTINWQNFYSGSNYIATARWDSTSQPGVFKETLTNVLGDGATITEYVKGCDGWLLYNTTPSITSSMKDFKETRAVGDKWTGTDPTTHEKYDYTVIKTNVSVTVPAGTFMCDELLYTIEGSINTDTVWWNNQYTNIKYSGLFAYYELASANY